MSNKTNASRRQLLTGTAAALALPSMWSTPLVKSIILPAHAQTSPMPSFSVEKLQSGGPNPATLTDDVIEYTITVTNTGDTPLTGVVATDTLPDGTVVVLSGPQESAAADGILEVGESWVYETSYTVTLDDVLAGADLTNTVSVEVDELPDAAQDDSADTPVVAAVCPAIVVSNALIGPVSGANSLTDCQLSFDIFSSDAAAPITIVSVETPGIMSSETVLFDSPTPFEVTSTQGLRVTWSGPTNGAFSCNATSTPVMDLDFVITSECAGVPGRTFSETVALSDVFALLT